MVARWFGVFACALIVAVPVINTQLPPKPPAARGWRAPRTPDGRPDLQGIWTNMTATPLQRPREFGDKSHFTRAEAAEYEEDRTGADLNDTYLDDRTVVPDLRTSLIVDPPSGRLPPFVPAAQAR